MKRILGLILTLTIFTAFVPYVNAATVVGYGTCGEDLTWELDSNGILTISGTGKMDWNKVGWNKAWKASDDIKNQVKSIVVEDGVTTICAFAFAYLYNLQDVTIADSVTTLDITSNLIGTFRDCYSLKSVLLSKNLNTIPISTFTGCTSLETINIASDATSYCTIEGVLYDKNMTTLCCYPNGKKDKAYILPDTIQYIRSSLSSLYLEKINISENNHYYTSVDGILFNKQITELICYPAGNPRKKYAIPNSVTAVEGGMFVNLDSLFVPKSVQSLSILCFKENENPSNIYYEGTENEWFEILNDWYDGMADYAPYTSNIHFSAIGIPEPQNNPQITSATASKSGSTYNFSVQTSDVAADCELITALYSGGEMVGVKSTQLSEGDTSKSVSITTNNATSAKVFIWDSLTGMRPLCDAKIVTIQ